MCVLIVFLIHIKQDTVSVCELKDILEESHLSLLHYNSLNTSFKLFFVLLLFFCLSVFVLFCFFYNSGLMKSDILSKKGRTLHAVSDGF